MTVAPVYQRSKETKVVNQLQMYTTECKVGIDKILSSVHTCGNNPHLGIV